MLLNAALRETEKDGPATPAAVVAGSVMYGGGVIVKSGISITVPL